MISDFGLLSLRDLILNKDARCSILDTRYSMLDTGYSILDTRYWILVEHRASRIYVVSFSLHQGDPVFAAVFGRLADGGRARAACFGLAAGLQRAAEPGRRGAERRSIDGKNATSKLMLRAWGLLI